MSYKYTYMHLAIVNEERGHGFEREWEGYMGQFVGNKRKGEI